MLTTPIAVEAQPGFRIWLEYDDGTEGVVDLEHLAGRSFQGLGRQVVDRTGLDHTTQVDNVGHRELRTRIVCRCVVP